MFNTTPTFMLGFFLLAVILGIGRLFQDAWITKDHKSKILQDHV
jgi:F0F1-type ATP synthase assembly protein I